ncbi:MAG: cysteine methyltransferase [Bacteroides sp.]|nr:cysteine methyltransferase [Bacteroides sp.]
MIQAVKEIVAAIPEGMVATYGDVAALAGEPTHARQVGKILGAIGMESEIPCHRVVNSEGRPAPHWLEQRLLLQREGVTFRRNGNVDMKRHRWHPECE